MLLDNNALQALNTAYSMAYNKAQETVTTFYGRYCMVETGNSTVLEFPFVEAFRKMREWIGDREIKNLKAKILRVIERAFEDTIGVPVRAVETDNYGVYKIHIGQMGQNSKELWDNLFIDALTANAAWLDNKPFFNATATGANARKWGKVAIVNKTTSALSVDEFNAGYDGMMGWDGHNKEPLGAIADVLMCGPALRTVAFNIVKNKYAADKTDNPNADLVDVDINPRLIGEYRNYWFLASTKGIMKPAIMKQSKDTGLIALDKETDTEVFMKDKILYGNKAYGECALAMPHLIYGGFVSV